MLKKLIILGVIVVLGLGALIGTLIYLNQPEVVVKNALKGVVEDFAKRDEIEPIAKMLEKGSLEVKVSSNSGSNAPVSQNISGKIYFSDKELMIEDLSFGAGDTKLSGDLYLSEEYSYISNDEILDGTYGIIRGEMADAFKDSIFAPGSGSEVEIPEEAFDGIVKMLEAFDDKKFSDIGDDFSKHGEDYLKFIYKSLTKHAEFESEKDEVKVGGEKIKARVITVTIDEEVLIAVLQDLVEELENDKKLREDVIEYGEYFSDLLDAYGGEDMDIEDAYDEMIDGLSDMVDSIEDYLPEFKVICEFVTKKSSSTLLQLTVSAKYEGTTQEIVSFDFGKDGIKKTDRIEISVLGYMSLKYEIKENSSDKYSATLKSVGYDKETITLLSIDVNKDKEKYTVKIPEMGYKITGDFISESKSTTITLGSVYINDEKMDLPISAELTIKEKDSMPDPVSKKKVTNICDISASDIEKIIENASELGLLFGAKEEVDDNYGDPDPDTSDFPDSYSAEQLLESKGYNVYYQYPDYSGLYTAIYAENYSTEDEIIIYYFYTEESANNAYNDIWYSTYNPMYQIGNIIYTGTYQATQDVYPGN